MDSKPLFYYFGDDEAYFRALVSEFGKTSKVAYQFHRFFESDEKKIQSFFLKVYKDHPVCIFIDFSKHSEEYLHLARIISRTNMQHSFISIGLVDFLSPPELLAESMATGVNLSYIKSAEIYDVVFGVFKIISPSEIGEHGFAAARLEDHFEAGIPAKIGFVSKKGLHFETDLPLSEGNDREINHFWRTKKIVPSREVSVVNVTTKNLFYHFKYAVDVDFKFLDDFTAPEGMMEATVEEKQQERVELLLRHQDQLSKWVSENQTQSLKKKSKILVVDNEFHFYNDQPRTDKNPYMIRSLASAADIVSELEKLFPQLIALNLDPPDNPDPVNTLEQLEVIINSINLVLQDKKPFVIVFNCKLTSNALKEKYDYENIMAIGNEISVDLTIKMMELIDKKIEKLTPPVKNKEEVVYLNKNNVASNGEISLPITITKLSELDMVFQSETDLPIGKNIHFLEPVDMFVCIRPYMSKGQSKKPEFYGIIHSIGEGPKKKLRQFINSVFFRDHDAQRNSETEEFKNLNVSKLLEKQEKERKIKEDAENKIKAEAAQKALEEEERKKSNEASQKDRQEKEQKLKEEAAKKALEEGERKKAEEALKIPVIEENKPS